MRTISEPRNARRKDWRWFALALGLAALIALGTRTVGREPAGRVRRVIDLDSLGWISGFAISPDGRTIATVGHRIIWPWEKPHAGGPVPTQAGHQGMVQLLDAATGKAGADLALEPEPESRHVRPIVFSPDGSKLVAGNWTGPDGPPISNSTMTPRPYLRAWDVATGKVLATLSVPTGFGRQVAFSSDGRTLTASLSAGPDAEQVLRWDTRGWSPIRGVTLATSRANSTAISPDGTLIAVSSFDPATITIYDLPSGRARSSFGQPSLAGTTRLFVELLFSPDGKTLAVLRG